MRFLADENFNNKILRGIHLQNPLVDILRAQDTDVYGATDPIVLAWAAENDRILLTHDVKTVPKYANQRIVAGLSMPGVIVARQELSVGQIIDELLMIESASQPEDWIGLVVFLPL